MHLRKTFLFALLVVVMLLGACATPAAPSAAPADEAAEAGAAGAADAGAPTEYANPDALVDTAWVSEHWQDEAVRIIDLSGAEDYTAGHIPGALNIELDRFTNPQDSTEGQIMTQDQLSALMSEAGVTQDTTVVFYDSRSNLLASRAYWVLKYYQHPEVRVYNGGTTKWTADGQTLVTDAVTVEPTEYTANEADLAIRTTTEYVLEHLEDPNVVMCDTRNPEEFAGTDVRAARGGHVPGALNVEWVHAVQEDGTFKDAAALYDLYTRAGFVPDKQIITYCQTGVRGAHTWFVLRELLGYPDVRNYDGSWVEYGNRDDTPIES